MLTKDETDNSTINYSCVKCGAENIFSKHTQWCKKCYLDYYNEHRSKEIRVTRCSRKLHDGSYESYLMSRTKHKAKKEKVVFDINIEWLKQKLSKGICEVTYMPLVKPVYKSVNNNNYRNWAPIIDRIDNSKGYTKSNCRIVISLYSMAKNKYGESDMLKMYEGNGSSPVASSLKDMRKAMIAL